MNTLLLTAILVTHPTLHVPCPGTSSAVACATRLYDECRIDVGQRYEAMTQTCKHLVLIHEVKHCLDPHDHGPAGGVLAECMGGIDLTAWASPQSSK